MSNSITTSTGTITCKDNIQKTGEKILTIENKKMKLRVRLENNAGNQFALGHSVKVTLLNNEPVLVDLAKIKSIIQKEIRHAVIAATSLEQYEGLV